MRKAIGRVILWFIRAVPGAVVDDAGVRRVMEPQMRRHDDAFADIRVRAAAAAEGCDILFDKLAIRDGRSPSVRLR